MQKRQNRLAVSTQCGRYDLKTRLHTIRHVAALRRSCVKLAFHGADTDTDTDILADFRARIVARMSACPAASLFSFKLATGIAMFSTSQTRRRILADLSDTRDFPREDPREDGR